MSSSTIRLLKGHELPRLWEIDRREYIANLYRLVDGVLVLAPHNFDVPGWPPGRQEEEGPRLAACLDRGGAAWAAFDGNVIAGGAVLDGRFIGSARDTLQLEWLHVSRDYRKSGLGGTLFRTAADKARALRARRLYISATPSENTVQFYMALGCAVATEVDPELFALEPEDIHMECPL